MHIKIIMPILLFAIMGNSCKKFSSPTMVALDTTGNLQAFLPEGEIKRIKYDIAPIRIIENSITCSGMALLKRDSKLIISFPAAGNIKLVNYTDGQFVTAGSVLAYIENVDFISLQQEFLEAKNQYEFYKEDYARQGELTIENATSIKKMQTAKRDFQSAESKFYAIKLKIRMLGINADSLRNESMFSALPVKSPSSGKITKVYINVGSFIDKGEALFELTVSNQLLFEIKVPEEYFKYINIGKIIDCSLAFDSLSVCPAKISSLPSDIDNRMAIVYAEIQEPHEKIIPGMSVKSRIVISSDTVHLVNASSILDDGMNSFLFAKKNGRFVKVPIKKISNGKMVEVSGLNNEMADSVVVYGIYKLNEYFKSNLVIHNHTVE